MTLERKFTEYEMWLYRRVLKIPWTAHVCNAEVLNCMGKEVEVP